MSQANPSQAHGALVESSAPHPQPGPSASEGLPIPPEGPPNIILRTGMKVSPEHRRFLDDVSSRDPSGAGPTPPVGPPNIELRVGMKLPPEHQLFLDDVCPHLPSGAGPTPPVGPPNIELRTGLDLRGMLADLLSAVFRTRPVRR